VARLMCRLTVAVTALTLLVAPPAMAWTVNDVIRDCAENGKLSHDYPPSLIRKARNNLPADVDEYTDCRDLLSAPSSSGHGSSGSGDGGSGDSGNASGSSGGGSSTSTTSSNKQSRTTASASRTAKAAATSAPPSPAETKALAQAQSGAAAESSGAGGLPVVQGEAASTVGAVNNRLPSTLVVVLILLALIVGVASTLLRSRRGPG